MFLSSFIAEVVLITYRSWKQGAQAPITGHLPPPYDYTSAALIFGALGLAGRTSAEPAAAVFGWGLVVATLLNLWTPKHPGRIAEHKSKKKTPAKVPEGAQIA